MEEKGTRTAKRYGGGRCPFYLMPEQAKPGGVQEKYTVRKAKCEICGCQIEPGAIERHHVVPTKVTEPAALPESQTLRLCRNCHQEVHRWYSARVSDVTYDAGTKRFRPKSWLEIVQEYHLAFNSFVNYKKKQAEHS